MTPPEEDDRNSLEKYHEFTLSWKSSSKEGSPHSNASPTEITINIQETPTSK
jgi:hypothetical protein